MSKFSLLMLLVMAFGSGVEAAPFCVQHFNAYGPIYALHVKDRTQRMTQELLSESDPCDVVQLIEVWNQSQIEQVIGAMSPVYHIEAPNLTIRNGLMSLVRGQVSASQTFDFPINKAAGFLEKLRSLANVKKSFLVSQVQLPALSESVYFVNTHLHPTSQLIRLAQIVDLFQWRMQNQSLKMILSGDFNADKNSLERALVMALLAAHDSLSEAMGGYAPLTCTYCEENPRSWLKGHMVFDYIFYSNVSQAASVLKPLSGEINLRGWPGNSLSDHYGVRVHFDSEVAVNVVTDDRQSEIMYEVQKSIDVLQTGDWKVYGPYINLLREVLTQTQGRAGNYWDYLSQYR